MADPATGPRMQGTYGLQKCNQGFSRIDSKHSWSAFG
jgi:hypothetical protein